MISIKYRYYCHKKYHFGKVSQLQVYTYTGATMLLKFTWVMISFP